MGCSVNEVVRKVIWSCLVEDCALFIRYILEKLTVKEKQVFILTKWLEDRFKSGSFRKNS